MKTLFIAFKIIVNAFLLAFYILFSVIFWNFLFWLFLTIFEKTVPDSTDPIHLKIAILVTFLTLLVSLLFRKYLYLEVFSSLRAICLSRSLKDKNLSNNEFKTQKNELNEKESKEEELEIYVNKEIK